MRDLLLVARYEFSRIVRQRRFLFFALGMPLFFVLLSSVPILIELAQEEPRVGYVDQSGLLADPLPPPEAPNVRLMPFAGEAAGRAALADGQIESLWLIPADYLQGGRVRAVAAGEPSGRQRRALADLLRANLLRGSDPALSERLDEPMRLSYVALDSGRRVRQGIELIVALLIPFGLAIAFALSIAFSSGFLAQAVAEEKENRLMEILVTSTRVWSLIAGKVIGLGAVALAQVLFWGVALIVVAIGFLLRGDLPRGLPIAWDILAWAVPFFLLAYTLLATLLVGIGVLVGESREAQQISGVLGILGVLPLWFVVPILEAPGGALARFFTLFPFTAPTLVTVRLALGQIALLEIALSLLILLLSVSVAVWGVSALFESAMLRYGTRLSINEALAALARRGP